MKSFPLEKQAHGGLALVKPLSPAISVGLGTCGIGNGALDLYEALQKASQGTGMLIKRAGCFGFCAEEPLAMLYYPGKPVLLYAQATAKDAKKLLAALESSDAFTRFARRARAKISRWDFRTSELNFGDAFPEVPEWKDLSFFSGQEKLVLRDAGLIDPENIDEYLAVGGYRALYKALTSMGPDEVIEAVVQSGLRGRGGAGFPTGKKWQLLKVNKGDEKYIICNADEGDPGAYMNRNEIESDPHMLLEGMLIGAYATGARHGFVYVRAEYPLAVERLRKAIDAARSYGILGPHVLGTDFSFDLELVCGAGAFVCGEETALIASAEGKAGRPLPRPPFPAQKGYQGYPTDINNVETWCNIPVIVARGASYFRTIGTEKSPGTKVFSLVGKVKNTGLVELPLGTPLNTIIYGMGEGAGNRKHIRAVQTGGPSGGCIPADKFPVPVDYESLTALGAIMGSGGMVVMDQDNCMVDVARYFTGFTASESCGKCAPCREGTAQMLRILTDISSGKGSLKDLEELEELAHTLKDASLCALGQTAANPVLTTLQYFRQEYEKHIAEKRCTAGVCESLYEALCENSCPLHMNIPGYLALLSEGRIEDAYELTLRDNPLPASMGRICHFHCQMRCRRETLDESVAQGEIHRYLADTMYKLGKDKEIWQKLVREKKPDTGKEIAIVGAGPAGLAAAFYLIRLGHRVMIYESHPKAGGILRYGIPAYRLPKDILDRELELWKKLGVRFTFNWKLGRDGQIDELKSRYDAVIVAIGAQGDRPLGIPGEDLAGVHPGYAWLEAFALGTSPSLSRSDTRSDTRGQALGQSPAQAKKIENRCLVIGGGNVAIDTARTLFRLGKEVTLVYRRSRTEMPANAVELAGAEEEGIRFEYMLQPEEITGSAGHVQAVRFRVMKPGGIDESGRPKPVPTDRTVDIPCDDVFIAVGERVLSESIAQQGFPVERDGRIRVNHITGKVQGNVYAIGDAVTGPATAAEAMGLGKSVARSIDQALMNRDIFSELYKQYSYPMTVPAEVEPSPMGRPKLVPPEDRKGNFQEISFGFNGEDALREARRCLRCDVRSNAMSPWR
ncbi:MAG: FAD-dependent oxidoreductase [Treponema sp.]|nr:FAD-dependent oxidoreductase [Treponema sp.]